MEQQLFIEGRNWRAFTQAVITKHGIAKSKRGIVMKKASLIPLWAALALWTVSAHAQSTAEKEITALEEQIFTSEQTNNPDLVAALFAEDYISTAADGLVASKAETLADAKERKYASSKGEDLKVKVYGDAAVAVGGYVGKGTAYGKPFSEHLRWTDTWIRMSGKWLLVASHYSNAKVKVGKPAP